MIALSDEQMQTVMTAAASWNPLTVSGSGVRRNHQHDGHRNAIAMSLLGVMRTWLCAPHMSAFDPKRT
jgi:hypothetical protein